MAPKCRWKMNKHLHYLTFYQMLKSKSGLGSISPFCNRKVCLVITQFSKNLVAYHFSHIESSFSPNDYLHHLLTKTNKQPKKPNLTRSIWCLLDSLTPSAPICLISYEVNCHVHCAMYHSMSETFRLILTCKYRDDTCRLENNYIVAWGQSTGDCGLTF